MGKIKFVVMSRREIEDKDYYGTITRPHVVISIADENEGPANIALNDSCMNILRFQFYDIDDIKYKDKYTLFDEKMAEDILDFANDMVLENFVDTFVVHCHAGVCRSVAVAAALSKILNNEDDKIFKSGCPNMLVYRTLLEKYFLTDNFHTRWESIWEVRESNLDAI